MKSELPKVLHPLKGKPLVLHVVDNLRAAGIRDITVVVGYCGQQVMDAAGSTLDYVWQKEQLGTGHAVMQTEDSLKDFNGLLLISCGDVPLIKPGTFRALINETQKNGVGASVLTMELDNPTGYGRIIKDQSGNFIKIVEEKDAGIKEKSVNEVNTGIYVFNKDLLFNGLKKIGRDNAQGEYYLPDVLLFIKESGFSIHTVLLENSIEGSGINSAEELERLENFMKN